MRIFIAIPLPSTIKEQLARDTALLQPKIKDGVRWVPNQNIHLTLRFLGESNDIQVQRLTNVMTLIAALPVFDITANHYGVFPAWKAPATIWLGIEKNEDLENLHNSIETLVQDCGFRPEKKAFQPHLTLARVKHNPSTNTISQIRHTFEPATTSITVPFQVNHVVLFQSILRPQGALYQALHTVALQC
jgi:2'-5' RNA ligase